MLVLQLECIYQLPNSENQYNLRINEKEKHLNSKKCKTKYKLSFEILTVLIFVLV